MKQALPDKFRSSFAHRPSALPRVSLNAMDSASQVSLLLTLLLFIHVYKQFCLLVNALGLEAARVCFLIGGFCCLIPLVRQLMPHWPDCLRKIHINSDLFLLPGQNTLTEKCRRKGLFGLTVPECSWSCWVVMAAGVWGSCTCYTQSLDTKKQVLVVNCLSPLCSPGPQPTQWCLPQLRWFSKLS